MTAIDRERSPLDPFSTSPNFGTCAVPSKSPKCIYANVWFAYQIEGKKYGITQGCCNHWDCPRCGLVRAKQEYWRMVKGIEALSEETDCLYLQTITCRGRGMDKGEADRSYLDWTNHLLDAYRAATIKSGQKWVYVQVTERQKRGLPHSHFITTFAPPKMYITVIEKWKVIQGEKKTIKQEVIKSQWMDKAVPRSGLGEQYDVSQIATPAAAARYLGKYLFKAMAFNSDWPPRWKRIRYSQSFPKLPEIKTDAFVLRDFRDWEKLARIAVRVVAQDEDTFEYAQWKLYASDCIVTRRKSAKKSD